jgi:hypothetical protein
VDSGVQPASLLHDHPGLFFTAVAAAFTLTRVGVVSRFDFTTVRGILAGSGTANVLLSSTWSFLPTLTGLLFAEMLGRALMQRTEKFAYLAFISGIAALILTPLVMLALFGALATFLALIRRGTKAQRHAGKTTPPARFRLQFLDHGMLMSMLLVLLLTGDMWLPPEVVAARSGDRVVGFVLGESNGWTQILRDSDRSIVEVLSVNIADRSLCEKDSTWFSLRLIEVIGDRTQYPECSTHDDSHNK